ncbi:MAG TPA: bifunctional phosphopantothenoylcysteine decarboxylase/phosphopantothenate--cysteine ligase CoaBC [Anaerolineales bacterium]|nr:bifunctional phosphopantothenoylcysteine decarboxylase/phosphopantothenate--cysteine ligase CoaBC [Anaerolineales bacterium]
MPNPITNKHILLGVTGSIACYKAADLASKLCQAGGEVETILTQAALQFITPLTFQSVTGRRAFVDADMWGAAGHVIHIGLADHADLVVIAPATANILAKLATGQTDNLLTLSALAAQCPIRIAPAMDGGMWNHPATQANVATLKARGLTFVGPAEGHLASGSWGVGRMVEPGDLLGQIRLHFSRGGLLKGHKIVVSAGGTQEPIDPVRVITNRSSGKQGYALAQAALDLGADVVLITSAAQLPSPVGAEVIPVSSAREMLEVVLETIMDASALLMAAAVADFRPSNPSANKIKKENTLPTITLERNPDILQTVGFLKHNHQYRGLTIGFAAESQNLLENAAAKIKVKKLNMIVANDISEAAAGFEVDTNRVTLLFPDGRQEALPLMSKDEVAERVMAVIVRLLGIGVES